MAYVCCHPASAYAAEEFAADAHAWIGADAPVLPHLAEVFPAARYSRPMPAGIYSSDTPFLTNLGLLYGHIDRPGRVGPPAVLVEARTATVLRNVLYTGGPGDARVVYETYRPNDRPYAALAAPGELAAAIPIQKDGRDFLYLGSVGSGNYGHWLVDDLPRLAAVRTLRALHPHTHIVVTVPGYSDPLNQAKIAAIEAALRDVDNFSIFFIAPGQAFAFDSMHLCSPVSYHPIAKSPAALDWVAAALVDPAPVSHRPVFVDRPPARGRALTNGAAIMDRLALRGFQRVEPDSMTFAEQVDCFSRASIVVGCMGAAMTNTLFSPRGAPVIHLAPDGWGEPFFWDLAAVRGQPYLVCFGSVEPGAPAPHLGSYSIDWPVLERALAVAQQRALAVAQRGAA